jgi:uncharacterized protein YukJ
VSSFLQRALKAREPLFSHAITNLERATNRHGVDVRLIADMLTHSHAIMRHLHLDIGDTEPSELYYALSSKFQDPAFESLLIKYDFLLIELSGQIVSMNLIDIIENYHHQLPFSRRVTTHGRRALAGELLQRYVSHKRTDESTVRQELTDMGLLINE